MKEETIVPGTAKDYLRWDFSSIVVPIGLQQCFSGVCGIKITCHVLKIFAKI